MCNLKEVRKIDNVENNIDTCTQSNLVKFGQRKDGWYCVERRVERTRRLYAAIELIALRPVLTAKI